MGDLSRGSDRRDEMDRRLGFDRRRFSVPIGLDRRKRENRRVQQTRRSGLDRRLYSFYASIT